MKTGPDSGAHVARRVREETLSSAVEMLAHITNILGTAVALTDRVTALSYTRGEERVGDEETGRVCWVESIALTLECGCVHRVEAVGGTIEQRPGRLCREHRPELVSVQAAPSKDVPF